MKKQVTFEAINKKIKKQERNALKLMDAYHSGFNAGFIAALYYIKINYKLEK